MSMLVITSCIIEGPKKGKNIHCNTLLPYSMCKNKPSAQQNKSVPHPAASRKDLHEKSHGLSFPISIYLAQLL